MSLETKSFAELGLSAKVLAAVEAAGYPSPTPIQAQAVPLAIEGRDILGIAQTGTGKTAAFVMPMIVRLETGRARARMPRSLILAPTRELAAQVAESFAKYGVNHKLDVALLIGGVSMDEQVKKLDRGVDVLIATPGRLLDHYGRGRIMMMGVEILVIDEADRMLDMGFIPDIEKICNLLPASRQTLFFSATMPPEITRLTETFLRDPVRIEVARPATAAATITQRFQYCPDGEDWAKREVLRGLIHSQEVKNAIIFCNRKRDVAILHKSLLKHGFNAGALHGDMEQSARTATLDKFRSGEILLLAASDVAARGLDIPDVSHVFNFDVPWHADDYVHRIGRTGRAGRSGFAATLVSPDDVKAMNEILKLTGEAAEWLGDAPTDDELADGARRKRGRGSRPATGRDSRSSSGRDARPPARETKDRAARPRSDRVTDGPRIDGQSAGETGTRDESAPRSEGRTSVRTRGGRDGRPGRDRSSGDRARVEAATPRADRPAPATDLASDQAPRSEQTTRTDQLDSARAELSGSERPMSDRSGPERSRSDRPRRGDRRPARASDRAATDRGPNDRVPQQADNAQRFAPSERHDQARTPRDDTAPRERSARPPRDRDDRRPRQDRAPPPRDQAPDRGPARGQDRGFADRESSRPAEPRTDRPDRSRPDTSRDSPRDVPRVAQPSRPERGPRRNTNDGGRPVGFEDNVPAFLRRPAKSGQ